MTCWLVNSNSKYKNNNPNGYKYMLRQNMVAAYYGVNWKVDKIKKGDLVLLYHNENRIIAVGCVVQEFEEHDYEEISDIEHRVDVNWIWKASFNEKSEPVNPINRYDVNISMVNGTVNNVSNQIDYKKLFEEIAKNQNFDL